MSLLKKLAKLFPQPVSPSLDLAVRCNRCGEIIHTRVNLYNDLSQDFTESGESIYFCRKVLSGEGRCFQRIEVELTFDAKRNLKGREIRGGQFVEAEQ